MAHGPLVLHIITYNNSAIIKAMFALTQPTEKDCTCTEKFLTPLFLLPNFFFSHNFFSFPSTKKRGDFSVFYDNLKNKVW